MISSIQNGLLYQEQPDGRIVCRVCEHLCCISNGQKGRCHVRINTDRKIQSLTYGYPQVIQLDTVDAKPFYHCTPGAKVLSFGMAGCNASCLNCINWEIVAASPTTLNASFVSPQDLVEQALREQCWGICATFTEPTVSFEYTFDVFQLANKAGLKTLMLTNGLMTQVALELLAPFLTAVKIDLKCSSRSRGLAFSGFDPSIARRTAEQLVCKGVWVEISTVIVPNIDLEEYRLIALFIRESLGANVPWHILRMMPAYKLSNQISTPWPGLQELTIFAQKTGLRHVYLGNFPGNDANHTYCARCNYLLIKRFGDTLVENHLACDRCPQCGDILAGVLTCPS